MILNVHHFKVEIINHVIHIVIKVILIVIMVVVLHHLNVHHSKVEIMQNVMHIVIFGQQCYCYTDTGAALSGLKRGLITKDDIECTPLEGGNYNVCNANCYE
eukprot:1120855_1